MTKNNSKPLTRGKKIGGKVGYSIVVTRFNFCVA